MNVTYETERLILAIGNENFSEQVRDYLVRNREDFAHWDRHLEDGYFTPKYVKKSLEAEQRLFMRSEAARFYIFLKSDLSKIIGNVSFTAINATSENCCSVGYKTDMEYRRKGYAYEALSFLMPIVAKEYKLKRMEADILPENRPSIGLITKLGFHYVNIIRSAHEIEGKPRDHIRYAYHVPVSLFVPTTNK